MIAPRPSKPENARTRVESNNRAARLADLPDVLTVSQVAEFLNVSEWLVREMIRQHQLRALRFGRILRIPKWAVEQLLEGER